jgi:two-component system, LytTR family, sensor kinase
MHIVYWLIYALLVFSFLMVLVNNNTQRNFLSISHFVFRTPIGLVAFLPAVIGFYTFYFYLFDRYLIKKRFKQLVAAGIVFILIGGVLTVIALSLPIGLNWRADLSWQDFAAMTTFLSLISLINGVIGIVLKGFITWYNEIRVKDELVRRNYEVELSLIKSQLNPHFLFNTINNIDVLIERDPRKASAYLNKLSEMMRFMLYETKVEKLSLSKELEYIEKYIELQRIRSSNPDYIQFEVKGDPGNTMIEPMLFIPFIENAFKHGEYKKGLDAIKISFDLSPEKIVFICENRFVPVIDNPPEQGGLGMNLIKRRLELLYPEKHSLLISTENGFFKINLTVSTHEV